MRNIKRFLLKIQYMRDKVLSANKNIELRDELRRKLQKESDILSGLHQVLDNRHWDALDRLLDISKELDDHKIAMQFRLLIRELDIYEELDEFITEPVEQEASKTPQ